MPSYGDANGSQIDHFKLLSRIPKIMKKVREAIQLMRNNNIINEYFIGCIKSSVNGRKRGGLVLDMAIRWNSTFVLLDRLGQHKDIVRNIFSLPNSLDGLTDKQKDKLHQLTLSREEWKILSGLRKVLEPFYVSVTVLSARHYPTLAPFFYVSKLILHFLKFTDEDVPLVVDFKQSLLR